MTEILTDFSPEAVIKANEQNMYANSPFSHGWKGTLVSKRPDIDWCVTDLDFHSSNCAFNARLTPQNADEAIEEFVAAGRKRKVALEWFVGHDTTPGDLAQRLLTHGFTSHGHSAGMAIDLNAIKEEPPPDGVEIIEAKDRKTVKILSQTLCRGFGAPQMVQITHKWFKRDIELGLPIKAYLAFLNGEPASVADYYLAAGVVGIYCVATIPEARNKGIGCTITQRALLDGRRLGYRIGVLQASDMGAPVYRRIGFKEYFQVESYVWTPGKK